MSLPQNLKYIHFAANYFGTLYLRIDSEHNFPKFTTSRIGLFWCAMIWITYTVCRISTLLMNEVDSSNIKAVSENYAMLLDTSVTLLCTIIRCLKQKLLIQALNELSEIDRSQKNMRKLIGKKLTFYVSGIGLMSIVIGMIPGILFFVNYTVKLNSYLDFISTSMKLLEMGLFETYLLLVRSRLQIVNIALTNLSKTTEGPVSRQPRCFQVLRINSNLEKLKKLRKLHSKLCSICEKINNVFAFQLLVLIGITFVEFTGFTYAFIDNLHRFIARHDEWYGIIWLFLMTLAKISTLTILCLVCTKTKNEIQRFSRQILHWNLKFTAFDFFDIDMTLIYEIITTATTYVAILIQFREA